MCEIFSGPRSIADVSHNRRWLYFFQAGVLFSKENVKFWPFLAWGGLTLKNFHISFGNTSLTHCRLVDLIDVAFAVENVNAKLVEFVMVADVDAEKLVYDSLVQLRFGQ